MLIFIVFVVKAVIIKYSIIWENIFYPMVELLNNKKMKVFFIGIGGVGMSALALWLFDRGFYVFGSDRSPNDITRRLQSKGIDVIIGHNDKNAVGADIIVTNSAIDDNNPELLYAKRNRLPVIKRAELLKLVGDTYKTRIGISGAHGKTTVTALLTHVLKDSGISFSAFIGGDDMTFNNYYNGGNDILLSEVCEFKKNIEYFYPDIAVTLNVDNDHLDSYDNFSKLKRTFFDFLGKAKTAVVNADDKNLADFGGKYISFGLSEKADYRAENLSEKGNTFTVYENEKKLFKIKTELNGVHNVYNVLAVIAVAKQLNISNKIIAHAIRNFKGVKRRNEFLGYLNGAKCYSDYAHHPKEISTLIKTIRTRRNGKIFFIFQPHTYSRTRILFNEFVQVLSQLKDLYLYKTYSAREPFDEKYSAAALAKEISGANYYDDFEGLINELKETVTRRDVIYFVGAGDVDQLCRNYVERSEK